MRKIPLLNVARKHIKVDGSLNPQHFLFKADKVKDLLQFEHIIIFGISDKASSHTQNIMAGSFFAGLRIGSMIMPDSAINYGNSPLPVIPPGAPQFSTPDGIINQVSSLLPGGLTTPYAYGTSARISTQTQMAHPNRVALIIPQLFIPACESDGFDMGDPIWEHGLSDGDFAFSFRLGTEMGGYGSSYCKSPYGHAAKAVPLLNVATVNYILWGLQVGMRRPKGKRWRDFFYKLTQSQIDEFRSNFFGTSTSKISEELVWNFIKTYLRPLGIQHGGDQQGGLHQGDSNSIVTHGAVDYVSSFAIEGRLQHVNNLWRDCDVHENDDLILALRYKQSPSMDINFNLSSSVRAQRTERVPVSSGYFYLRPETLQFRSFSDCCYIHVGRSFKYCSQFIRGGPEAACWDARVPVVPGAPIMITFEPDFVDSDDIFYAQQDLDDEDEDTKEDGYDSDDNDHGTEGKEGSEKKNKLSKKRKMAARGIEDDDEEEEDDADGRRGGGAESSGGDDDSDKGDDDDDDSSDVPTHGLRMAARNAQFATPPPLPPKNGKGSALEPASKGKDTAAASTSTKAVVHKPSDAVTADAGAKAASSSSSAAKKAKPTVPTTTTGTGSGSSSKSSSASSSSSSAIQNLLGMIGGGGGAQPAAAANNADGTHAAVTAKGGANAQKSNHSGAKSSATTASAAGTPLHPGDEHHPQAK